MTAPRPNALRAAADNVEQPLRTLVWRSIHAMLSGPDGLGVSYRRERRRLLRIALRAVQGARRG